MSFSKRISIFGVTGSVGRSACEVVLARPDYFDVYAVTAGSNAQTLAKAAIEVGAKVAVIADEKRLAELERELSGTGIIAKGGNAEMVQIAREKVDVMLAATAGFAGLRPILAALESGVSVAIANKEPLVAAGEYVMSLARKNGAKILPVDSEHNAIFQVFENENFEQISSVTLTASGGPFRAWTADEMKAARKEQALCHPNWVMGPKITIDSATMMNKALEVIEAHYLFGLPADKIKVLIHPQSIIHSMVTYKDGSTLAQMGVSDMRIPIASALAWPQRIDYSANKLDLAKIQTLSFEEPDFEKFKALQLAYKALEVGQMACVALNASNEVAVAAFLDDEITFAQIIEIVSDCFNHVISKNGRTSLKTVEEIEEFDTMVRTLTRAMIKGPEV